MFGFEGINVESDSRELSFFYALISDNCFFFEKICYNISKRAEQVPPCPIKSPINVILELVISRRLLLVLLY